MLANGGKFRDRNPELLAAGKLTAGGDHTTDCINVEVSASHRKNTPDLIKEIRKMTYPEPGEKRVYVGKYTNPALVTEMRHGIKSRSSENAGSLVTPPPKTFFQQNLIERKEQIYETKQRKPLGKIPDQTDKLAEGVSIMDRFGIRTKKSLSADIVVNPKISRDQVEADSIEGIDLYRVSHHHSRVGEQKDLNYNWSRVKKTDVFGVETPHNNDGVHVKNSLLWSEDNKNTQTLVSKRLDNFKERTQPKLGEVHDPMKDTMNITPDHTFGVMIKPDEYGAGDLIHSREANSYLRARDRQRGAVAAIRDHLKKANYHNFHDLSEAFNSYDVNKSGKIESEDLLRVCKGFHLPIDSYLLNDLISYCDSDDDGKIDYIDFCNFLNWRYELPNEQLKKTQEKLGEEVSDGKDEPDRTRQIDTNIGDHQTSSSVINAIAGKVPTQSYRSFGVPTIRSDLPAPHIKRVGDYTNYGEQSDVYGLVNPSIYTTKGLTERDFFQVRPKEDLRKIFEAMKLGYPDDVFEKIYNQACSRDAGGNVSVDSFLQTLKSGPQS